VNRTLTDQQTSIHATAVVDPESRIGHGVHIGPFCVIGPHVTLGDGCRLHNNVTVTGYTDVGPGCEFFAGCVLGTIPQDLKYRGEKTRLVIGNDNIFREHVTAHPGTPGGGGVTRIGAHNLIMIGAHVGHDANIHNHCIVANNVLLAGHVLIEDFVTVGGAVAIHHFVTVGKYAMVAGMTRVSADVPPFLTVASTRTNRQEVRMVNGVGLQRRGFSHEQIRNLKTAYMRLFSRRARATGVPIARTIADIKAEDPDENVAYLCDFLLRSFECGRKGRYLESLRTDHKQQGPPER
jgi:UDP-N-acetylglucosamine acyltransferase